MKNENKIDVQKHESPTSGTLPNTLEYLHLLQFSLFEPIDLSVHSLSVRFYFLDFNSIFLLFLYLLYFSRYRVSVYIVKHQMMVDY